MTVRARFDGKVFVPIDPVDLVKDEIVELDMRAETPPRKGSAAAVLEAIASAPHVSKDDLDAWERAIEEGKLPVRNDGIFDDLRQPMIYLFDSNALRDLMDQHVRFVARFTAVAGAHRVAVCATVRGEAWFGVERLPAGKRRDAVAAKVRQVLTSLDGEPVSVSAAEHYARIKRAREQAGTPMDENDLWIAATALAINAVLVTRDADFTGVPGLAIEDWTV